MHMPNKEDFYNLSREYGRYGDHSPLKVVIKGGDRKDLYLGKGNWITDILYPNGNITQNVPLEIKRDEIGNEIVILGKEIGGFLETLDDDKLSELRFYIYFSN